MSPRRVSFLSPDELVTEAQALRREIERRKECLDRATSPCTSGMQKHDPDLLCAACAARYHARKLLVSLTRWRDTQDAQVPVKEPPR